MESVKWGVVEDEVGPVSKDQILQFLVCQAKQFGCGVTLRLWIFEQVECNPFAFQKDDFGCNRDD